MKRKLDNNDVPTPLPKDEVPKTNLSEYDPPKDDTKFSDLGLDFRLLQAISKQKYQRPTLVQNKAIPLALEGRDILARARTGSGKTAAYLLPIIHSILKRKQTTPSPCISTLILVPTRELAEQAYKDAESLCIFCAKDVRAVNLTRKISDAVQQSLLADLPDIVIATPARANSALQNTFFTLEKITHLVIDEADLVLSYGYDNDLQSVAKLVPKGVQTFLMSATLTNEVEILKGIFCRNPAILKLNEKEDEGEGLVQYVVKCAEDEKFLLIYVIFKLQLVKGKCIIFVGQIDRCYRVKLFLEQFGIRSCILNSELPVNSRIHVVEEFNKGFYDIIIASDEYEMLGNESEATEHGENSDQEFKEARKLGDDKKRHESDTEPPIKRKRKVTKRDREYGISRGVDFKNVACVLNFDLPTSSKSYIHRIGRTARAGQTGMALSFVIPADQYHKHPPTSIESTKDDEKVLAKIVKHQKKTGKEIKAYNFDMKQVEAFRYRLGDALRAVTAVAIREARIRELRQELIKSDKLKRHFEENPKDLHHLRHDGELKPARIQSHMRHVPDYLLPQGGKKALVPVDVSHISLKKTTDNRVRKARGKFRKTVGRKLDPLKNFKARAQF